MSEKHRCEEMVIPIGSYHQEQCERNAVVCDSGKWVCAVHAKHAIEKRRIKRKLATADTAFRDKETEDMRLHHNGLLMDDVAEYLDASLECETHEERFAKILELMADYKPKPKAVKS